MTDHVVFLLDNDKDFLELYTRLLQSKGCQVFATDNLFLLMKYAQSALPEWIFIDENFATSRENEIVKIINKGLPFNHTHFAIMSQHPSDKNPLSDKNIEFIYKPEVLEKIMQITQNSCIVQ